MTLIEWLLIAGVALVALGVVTMIMYLRVAVQLLWQLGHDHEGDPEGAPPGISLGDIVGNGASRAAHENRTEVILSEEDEFFSRRARAPETEESE